MSSVLKSSCWPWYRALCISVTTGRAGTLRRAPCSHSLSTLHIGTTGNTSELKLGLGSVESAGPPMVGPSALLGPAHDPFAWHDPMESATQSVLSDFDGTSPWLTDSTWGTTNNTDWLRQPSCCSTSHVDSVAWAGAPPSGSRSHPPIPILSEGSALEGFTRRQRKPRQDPYARAGQHSSPSAALSSPGSSTSASTPLYAPSPSLSPAAPGHLPTLRLTFSRARNAQFSLSRDDIDRILGEPKPPATTCQCCGKRVAHGGLERHLETHTSDDREDLVHCIGTPPELQPLDGVQRERYLHKTTGKLFVGNYGIGFSERGAYLRQLRQGTCLPRAHTGTRASHRRKSAWATEGHLHHPMRTMGNSTPIAFLYAGQG
ncbi:uncharacterized protein C8Q71DRAFT_535384 [Rhodofomes roseus]|uniref:C2H2-type domain-containing protein n=1 Tax=Rhodofomes roseus TaxID=34475 RepID=A0ABQ8KKV3_9APHY|nr:uncharacterized protein C8Q71DRAFT_535384 [Rhodofomes roseus]KAH9838545.1 hypothetical protein C8Q71DRAFT_535384 [Rhodofomes roseus]